MILKVRNVLVLVYSLREFIRFAAEPVERGKDTTSHVKFVVKQLPDTCAVAHISAINLRAN